MPVPRSGNPSIRGRNLQRAGRPGPRTMTPAGETFLYTGPGPRGETEQQDRPAGAPARAESGLCPSGHAARKMHEGVVMRTLAKLSLFTLAPALLLAPAVARAQAVYPPAQQNGLPTQEGYAPPTPEQVSGADPY